MAIQSMLPSKKVIEVVHVTADFAKYLLPNDFIVFAACTVSTFSGEDADPSYLLYDSIEIVGDQVSHRIRAGLPGVVYVIRFLVLTDLDQELEWFMKLAVLPNVVPAGDIFIDLYLTTPPYPVYILEGLDSAGTVLSGFTLGAYQDALDSSSIILSGDLRSPLITYSMEPEGIDSTSSIVSGALPVILIQYSIEPEGIDSTPAIVSGELKIGLITYSNWPAEGILSAGAIVSGTLA